MARAESGREVVADNEDEPIDGRRARRERGRAAVVEALFTLFERQDDPPQVEQVAALAGVSVSSVFRYFGSLDDLHREAIERFLDRYRSLLEPAGLGVGDRSARIAGLVDARIELYEMTGAVLRAGRSRSLDHPTLAEAAMRVRARLLRQVEVALGPELESLPGRARAGELAMLADSLTSPEAWEWLVRFHGRSPRQIAKAWRRGLAALVATVD